MDARAFYRLPGPSTWAEPPRAYSYSSLRSMKQCLRRWQLLSSAYGELPRCPERPLEATAVGIIVHELLSRLFHAMALAGYPAIGSSEFRAALARLDLVAEARRRLDEVKKQAAVNPRAGAFQVKATELTVYNKVAQAFRAEYARVAAAPRPELAPAPEEATVPDGAPPGSPRLRELCRQGFLSEEQVRHPELPLVGIIDLLVRRAGQTVVLDFKTGATRPEHRDQLLLYALLWWRSTGDPPARVEVRYGSVVAEWAVSEEELVALESDLATTMARLRADLALRPAAASLGPHCAGCPVRQYCTPYWQEGLPEAPVVEGAWVDMELMASGAITGAGLVGRDRGGREVMVVFDEEVGVFHGPFAPGERLRILGAQVERGGVLRLTQATEVFHAKGPPTESQGRPR